MTKRFCDICGKPAEEIKTETSRNHGEPYKAFSTPKQCEGVWQAKITVSVHFGFREHPTGFGGPPDLCQECANSLIAELLPKTAA